MTFLRKTLLSLRVAVLFAKRQKKAALFLVALIILILGAGILLKDNFRPEISEGVVGTYTEKDLPPVVTNLLSWGLLKTDGQGLVTENAAKLEPGNDAANYSVKLKDLNWVDETKVSAYDISFSLPDVEVKVKDDKTIEFKLADSFSPFPTLLTKPVFKKNSLVGFGSYKVKEIQKEKIFIKKIILKPLDEKMPFVVVKFYPNEKIAKNALKLGEVKVLLGVQEPDEFKSEKTLGLLQRPNFQQLVTIFYNTKDAVLSDENLRLALSYQAPSIKGEIEAKTSIPPSSFVFQDEVKDFLDNPEKAKASFDKVQKKDKVVLTSTTSLKNVGEQIVSEWKKLGVDAVLRIESGIPQNFQALLIAQNIPVDPDQYSLWHSTQLTNISKFASPRIDKDLEDGRKVADTEVRKQKYQDFQKVLLDHAPATFMYFPKYNILYRKKDEQLLMSIIKLQIPQLF